MVIAIASHTHKRNKYSFNNLFVELQDVVNYYSLFLLLNSFFTEFSFNKFWLHKTTTIFNNKLVFKQTLK